MAAVYVLSGLLLAAHAAVDLREAAELGHALTQVGAEAGPNRDHSIRRWYGGSYFSTQLRSLTADQMQRMSVAQFEQLAHGLLAQRPQLVITAQNAAEYADHLTDGHKALLARFADYKMAVYGSYRTAFFPEAVYAATRHNALHSRLIGTDQVEGAGLGFPFPIPRSGAEIIWNHKMKFVGNAVRRIVSSAVVDAAGGLRLTRTREDIAFKYANLLQHGSDGGTLFYYLSEFLAPPARNGVLRLVYEPADQSRHPRQAWIYFPGERLVRRAPELSFDDPVDDTADLQFADQVNMFSGALSRYRWSIVGKREIYIPYNSVAINNRRYQYREILRPGHLNQELARYELHRVWVVDATLRAAAHHAIRRRRFYVDEDSWTIAAVDCYDASDRLWRFQESHLTTLPFVPTVIGGPELIYDFRGGRYWATGLSNEEPAADFQIEFPDQHFDTNTVMGDAHR